MPSISGCFRKSVELVELAAEGEERPDISQIVKDRLNIDPQFKRKTEWKKVFEQIPSEEDADCKQLFTDIADAVAKCDDPFKVMGRIAELIDIETLQKACTEVVDDFGGEDVGEAAFDYFGRAQVLLNNARNELEREQNQSMSSLQRRAAKLGGYMLPVLESVLASFGIANILKSPFSAKE